MLKELLEEYSKRQKSFDRNVRSKIVFYCGFETYVKLKPLIDNLNSGIAQSG